MSITYRQLALIQFFAALAILTHWLANLWALSLLLVDENSGIPRWTDTFKDMEEGVDSKTPDTPWKLYVASVYFTSYTLTSVGYGDIGPVNIQERIVCTIMIIISGTSWALVLGQVCGILASMSIDEQAYRTRMDELSIMMEFRNFPKGMRHRVRTFVMASKTAARNQRYREVLVSLSPGLRGEVALQTNRLWIEKVSFLKPFLRAPAIPMIIVEVCLVLEFSVYSQSETFGQCQVLYILNRGLASHRGRFQRKGSI